MSMRFNEDDVATSGANKILQLDATGKIPAVDGSNLTNVVGEGYNGLSFAYTTDNTTNITGGIDRFYYIPQANEKVSAGGNVVNINLPYSNKVVNGSKIGFEYIPLNGTTLGGQYTITTPSNASLAAHGWTSFELFIEGESYSDGAVFSSKQGANRTRVLYAYVSGTNLKWFEVRGGNKSLSTMSQFDLNSTNPYQTGRTYTIAGKGTITQGFVNVENYAPKQFNIALSAGTSTTMNLVTNMPSARRSFFITNTFTTNSGDWGILTLPAANTTEGILYHFHMGLTFGNATTRFNSLQIQHSANFRWTAGSNFSGFVAFGGQYTHNEYFIVSDGANYYAGILERF